RMSTDPDVQLALNAPEGASFTDDASGEVVRRLPRPGGTHGGLPSRRGIESSFIAWGPGIEAGADLHRIRMTRIGPTILKALGIDEPTFGDDPPIHEIFRSGKTDFAHPKQPH